MQWSTSSGMILAVGVKWFEARFARLEVKAAWLGRTPALEAYRLAGCCTGLHSVTGYDSSQTGRCSLACAWNTGGYAGGNGSIHFS